jgi:predicted KAP-like P-loop ATPase
MIEKYFVSENPISTFEEDLLSRKIYAENIAQALIGWDEDKSLVIGLYGEWGSGKTSLINLVLNEVINISEKKNDKIDVIRFNPWMYSESDNLLDSFINELKVALGKKQNKDLTKKLEQYSELLTLTPRKEQFKPAFNWLISILVLLGITSTQISQFLLKIPKFVEKFLFSIGIVCFLFVIFSPIITWILSFLRIKTKYSEKSIDQLKNDIIKSLKKTNRKILIVIDDIDRLTGQEIRQIFRIIRTNADFSNTIYLLAFDRDIIEKNLNVQEGISGREYLEKIVQVNFTLPSTPDNKIHDYLLNKFSEFISSLPNTVNKYFDDPSYFSSIFHSGFKYFFKNIRDVKRYMNSIKFNILQLIQEDMFEINPVDMSAIEVLRVF